jgi:hypothetical protein
MNSDDLVVKLGILDTQVKHLGERIDHFETVCQGCRGSVNEQINGVYGRIDALSERLRKLEIRVAFIAGGAALIGTIIGQLLP